MNKDQLQKELKGIKPPDLKKKPIKPKPKHDESYLSGEEEKIIPTVPTPSSNLLALQKQIELHKEIKKADEKKKQELQERIKTLIKLAGEEKKEWEKKVGYFIENIKDLQQKQTIEELKKEVKNKGEVKGEPIKTEELYQSTKYYLFTCDICE